MPLFYLSIWFERKGFLWELLRKALPSIRVLDAEIRNGILYEWHMLLRPQKNLYRLPSHKPFRSECGY